MNYGSVVDKLDVGKQYTLVSMGEFGFPYAIQMKLTGVEATKYAQYDDAVQIDFIVKGKRKETGIRFYGSKKLVIWEGFVNPNVEMYGAAKVSNGMTVRESKWSSFDPRYIQTAINSVEQTPIVDSTKEMMKNE